MEEILRKQNGVELVQVGDLSYEVRYNGTKLHDDLITNYEDASLFMNGIFLGVRMVETYGLEVFRAVETIIEEQNGTV
jgi:hypothetical protein